MVITCAAAFCYNSNGDKQKPVSFFRFPRDVQQSNKWSLLIGRHDLLDGKINSQRVCSDHFDKSSITSPTAGTNVRLISGAMPMKVYQTDECNKVSLDKSSVIIEKCSTPVNNKEPCTWISTSSTQSPSQTSAQISQLICTDTSSVRGCKSKDSDNEHKIKFFNKFSKDDSSSYLWVQAVNEENLASKNNNCNVHLNNGVYKKKLNLLKLTRKAVPNISYSGNVEQNVKPKIIVMNSNLKSSQKPDRKSNILSDHTYVCSGNVKLQKMNLNSDSKSSQKHVKKIHDKLSDHSYVLKLPASSAPDETSSGKGTVQNLKLDDKVEPCIIDLTESDKPICRSTNKSTKRIENLNLVHFDKKSFENKEIDWREVVSAQAIMIKELRKKVKVLQQKIRRHNTKIEALRMKGI